MALVSERIKLVKLRMELRNKRGAASLLKLLVSLPIPGQRTELTNIRILLIIARGHSHDFISCQSHRGQGMGNSILCLGFEYTGADA